MIEVNTKRSKTEGGKKEELEDDDEEGSDDATTTSGSYVLENKDRGNVWMEQRKTQTPAAEAIV